MTGRQIIYRALRLLGHLQGAGQGAATEEESDGLDALNALLASLAADQTYIFSVGSTSYSVASGEATYTVKQLVSFPAVTTAFTAPQGYFDCLAFNLAVRMAAQWGLDVPASVAAEAERTRASAKNLNSVMFMQAANQ